VIATLDNIVGVAGPRGWSGGPVTQP